MGQGGQDELQSILDAWKLSSSLHEFHDGASTHEIEALEQQLGFSLPAVFADLYRFSNGLGALGGNLCVHRLTCRNEGAGLATASDALREWGWPIPPELVVFGGNGADALFGIWLTDQTAASERCPVICLGESFEPACMAVFGTSLERFLKYWSAYYVMVEDGPTEALDLLKVPLELRCADPDNDTFAALAAWADPELPRIPPDPYEAPMTADDLRKLYGAR